MRILSVLALATGLFMAAGAANAQATRTWISGVGDDVNPCSRTAPCKTFPGAITKTVAGGEIDTLDPGGFGAVTVTKAITLANEGIGEAGILVAGTNGVTVNCSTDPNCHVVVRGLQFDGGPLGSNSLNGIRFIAGGSLVIENCTIRNFTGGDPNGAGVQFNPGGSATTYLSIDHSQIMNNGQVGSSNSGSGVLVLPSGSGAVNVSITNTQIVNNIRGVVIDGTGGGTGAIHAVISTSETSNSQVGVFVKSTSAPVFVSLDRDVIAHNTNAGVKASGSTVTVRVGGSVIANNATGVLTVGTPTVTSYGNNQVQDNTAAGYAMPVVGLN